MKRHISLYFGSITTNYIFQSLLAFVVTPFFSRKKVNSLLAETIKKRFGNDVSVYFFGSARSGIASCLNAIAKIAKRKEGNVIVSAYTCLAVPTGIVASSQKPVYVDIEVKTLNTDIVKVLDALNSQTVAILGQHTLGSLIDIQQLKNKINNENLYIIEDCALAVGSKKSNYEAGIIGDAAIFSMELSKTISVGWGGILILRNTIIDQQMKYIYSNISVERTGQAIAAIIQTCILGFAYNPYIYHFGGKYLIYFGYKYKMFRHSTPSNEIDGCVSLDFIRKMSKPSMWLANYQWKRLDRISSIIDLNCREIIHHLRKNGFCVLGEFEAMEKIVTPRISFLVRDRSIAIDFFAQQDIELGVWFDGPLSPLPRSVVFNYANMNYPNANLVAKHVVNMPSHSRLSTADVKKIKIIISEFINQHPDATFSF